MLGFILGAIAGGLAATYWQPDVNRVRSEKMSQLRERLACHVETAERAIVQQVGSLSMKARGMLRGESGRRGGAAARETTPGSAGRVPSIG
jgi:hypothetical protein